MTNLKKLFRTDIGNLPRLEKHNIKQVSTHHHAGPKNHMDFVQIAPQTSYKFPLIEGPGIINCIWFTISPAGLPWILNFNTGKKITMPSPRITLQIRQNLFLENN